ncbi:hypothetical protein [Pseudomonas sp. NA-150]|uniref:hypothetical protein n=1 Tax=Pseudomonas sp. NA-150 TaxID=3367525 RepID=UPI0037C8A927
MPTLRATGVATVFLILPFPGVAYASIWQTTVAVPTTVEYDSNPTLATSGEKGVTRTIVAPDFGLVGAFGADQLQFGLGVNFVRSSDTDIIKNREDPDLRVGWERENEKGRFGLTARYVESSTLSDAVEQTGVVATDGTQKLYTLAGNWSTALTERSTLENEIEYAHATYDVVTLTDYDELSARVGWRYAWNERTQVFTRFAARRYEPDQGSGVQSSNSYTPTVEIKYQFSERFEGALRLGVDQESGTSSGPTGQGGFDFHYKGERMDASIDVDRSSVASGQGGFAEVDRVQGSWSYALDEISRVGLDATWQDSKGQTPNTLQKYGAWASRELSPFWVMRLSLLYKERQQNALPDARANVIGLSLTYSFPDL